MKRVKPATALTSLNLLTTSGPAPRFDFSCRVWTNLLTVAYLLYWLVRLACLVAALQLYYPLSLEAVMAYEYCLRIARELLPLWLTSQIMWFSKINKKAPRSLRKLLSCEFSRCNPSAHKCGVRVVQGNQQLTTPVPSYCQWGACIVLFDGNCSVLQQRRLEIRRVSRIIHRRSQSSQAMKWNILG